MRPERPAPLLCRCLMPLHACTLCVRQGYRPHQPLRWSHNTADPGGTYTRTFEECRKAPVPRRLPYVCCSCSSFLPPRRAGLPIVAGGKIIGLHCVIYYCCPSMSGRIGSYNSLFPYRAMNAFRASSGVIPDCCRFNSHAVCAFRLRYRFVSLQR